MKNLIKRVYRCGGGSEKELVDYIAIQFYDRKTEYIIDNKKDSISKQVKEAVKKINNDNTN